MITPVILPFLNRVHRPTPKIPFNHPHKAHKAGNVWLWISPICHTLESPGKRRVWGEIVSNRLPVGVSVGDYVSCGNWGWKTHPPWVALFPGQGTLCCGGSELSSNMRTLMDCSLLSTVDVIRLAASRACHLTSPQWRTATWNLNQANPSSSE